MEQRGTKEEQKLSIRMNEYVEERKMRTCYAFLLQNSYFLCEKFPLVGINELIQSLQRIQTVLKSNGHRISEDMTLVAQLLTNPEFQKVLAVHNKVQETWCLNRPPTPVTDNAQGLVAEVQFLLPFMCWIYEIIIHINGQLIGLDTEGTQG